MQLLILLNSGLSPKGVAKKSVKEIMDANEIGFITFKCTCIAFVEECLRAIGIECRINPEDIISKSAILWPKDINTYTFKLSAPISQFEKFLICFCEEFHRKKVSYNAVNEGDRAEEIDDERYNCPIALLMKIVVVSYNIFKDLQSQESEKVIKQFEEPIARLCFHYLVGIYSVRKLYRNELSLLDKLCDQLYKKAVLGIRYPQSNLPIIKGILEIFETDFFLFYVTSKDVIYFYYNVLSMDFKTPEVLKMTFDSLKNMIKRLMTGHNEDSDEIPSSRKIMILTDFLISREMQKVYYKILKSRRKYHTIACLNFINVLQNSLLSLDCFSNAFLVGVQNLVLDKMAAISTAASKVYMNILLKKMGSGEVLKHILTFFKKKRRKSVNLKQYVKALFPYFTDEICVLDYYVTIINQTNHQHRSHHLKAIKFLFSVFVEMFTEFSKYKGFITDIVNKLPYFLETETCCYAKNVYLGFYHVLFCYKRLPSNLKHIMYADLIKFTDKEFNRKTPNYTCKYITKVFLIYIRCLKYSKNLSHLDVTSCAHLWEMDQVEMKLNKLKHENKLPSYEVILAYREILLKINLYLKIGLDVFTDSLVLKINYQKLWPRFADFSQILTYSRDTQTFLDIYACEVLTLYLMRIAKLKNYSNNGTEWLIGEAQKLFDLFMQHLQTAAHQSQIRFNWMKTLIVSICGIYYKFGNPNRISGLKCNINQYHSILNSSLMLTFKYNKVKIPVANSNHEHCEQLYLSPKCLLGYKKDILRNLTTLHGESGIKPPSLSLWKILIFFGQNTHYFHKELESLMKSIALHHFEEYKRIIAVLIYNLGGQYDAITIKRILIAHNEFIKNTFTRFDNKYLRVHIVILVVQIVKKTLKNLAIDNVNRMRILEYLHILLNDLQLDVQNMQDVFRLFASLQTFKNISSAEKHSLMKFLKPYEDQLMEINFITPRQKKAY